MKGAYSRKSHSGTPGSKAACAYPGRYRGLPRPSSALKPSHPPDSVACFGPLVVFVWRLVKHISICCVASLIVCPMHGVILIFARVVAKSVHPSLLIDAVGSCIYFDGITHIAELH